ncbi:MAG TPA: AtpZ/AtpI family protein, partial [Phycisphaerales bacterium]|nr:AtpZ/AtpI family protein [Phycisphaerales bacterium]
FSAVGLEVVLYVAVGGGVGWLLDRWLGTGPWLLMSLLLLGVVGGSYRFVREGLAANRRVASEAADRRRAGQTPGGS